MSSHEKSQSLRRVAAVVGIGHTDWKSDWATVRAGGRPTDAYGYAAIAFSRALADCGLARDDVDGLVAGWPVLQTERTGELLGINPHWSVQADAVNAVQSACMAIATGMAEVVALVYGNDQRSAGTKYGGSKAMGADQFLAYSYHAPWGFTSQGALYALTQRRYMYETGATEADLGHVAVAVREWASRNPNAILQKPITIEDYLASPYICEPLRMLDYCLVNDGGVAMILTDASRAEKMTSRPVYIEAVGRADLNVGATSLAPRLDGFYYPAQKECAERLFNMAGIGPEDVDSLQVYDSFSTHIPLALEGYGYCEIGGAPKFLRDRGIGPGGNLPVNTSGGHLSESYMQGWNHQIEAVLQLRDHAIGRQIEDCRYVHYASDVAGKCTSVLYSR